VSAPKPIQIGGGGLAGLTLGIALRKRGTPVTIFEAGDYPRHRVCGEFINGRGLDVLDALDLKQRFLDAGAVYAESAAFFLGKSGAPIHRLPMPALCLSRFVMDKLLADEFQKRGGDLRTGERWQNDFGDGVVRASGRRAQPVENGWRWFGLKAHAKNVPLAADLEMHLGENGYVGLCRLADGEVNACGLFRRSGVNDLPANGFDLLRGNPGTALNERLAHAEFEEKSFCSVAGLSLQPRAADKSECCIGDALTMIPPVTGNGMSLALESAQIAAGPLAEFSRGKISWNEARGTIARALGGNFSSRLRWANWLQGLMFSPLLRTPFGKFLFQSETFWKIMFAKTR
jgi:flavin-dependent dehydrogenase